MGLLFHATILFFTFEQTYDAYVHIFFADHYAQNWFDSWNFKWYTGFTITSYPPLVHQIIALFSKLVGLKIAFYFWSILAMFLFIRGVYKFSLLWVDHKSAGIAAILAVFCSSAVEALHIFGQVPSLTGMAFLLNACPEIYKWFRYKKKINFFLALALLAVTTSAHHVTTIFGMVFFVLPVIGLAVMDLSTEEVGGNIKDLSLKVFIAKAIKVIPGAAFFGLLAITITIFTIFPYWYWSKTDPITQVSIPHGSRENFWIEGNLGIIFFLIPWGMMLLFLPYLFTNIFKRRNIFLGIAVTLAFILGTGGTTPIPKMILGENAFNILTLDRFTFWATILSLPFWGAFFNALIFGSFKDYLQNKFGNSFYKFILSLFLIGVILVNVLIVNLGNFRPFQPEKINVKPITNFLSTDQHSNWRYLTLGFGDQVAWLSANTDALTVDGNYHSVRRLPEMTTRAVERLENAKYQGMEGLGALQDFLTTPDRYHLKYIFSNDKFYEPLLHFSGWDKITQLENNIIVWERPDVAPLPTILPARRIPYYQRIMWGVLPLSSFALAFIIYLLSRTIYHKEDDHILLERKTNKTNHHWGLNLIWIALLSCFIAFVTIKNIITNSENSTPEQLALTYFDALDFKNFDKAFSLLDRETKPSLDQFILELSVEDGILASFAKLDNIQQSTLHADEENAVVNVEALWITSLMEYNTTHQLNMKKRKGSWYIVKDEFEKRTPPDQFYSLPQLSFKNQGRRKTNTDLTNKEDILDRPEVSILSSRMIVKDSIISIVGEAQNIDNIPAYISVEANIYDDNGTLIKNYGAMDKIVHDLLPKEITSFRIVMGHMNDFESVTDYVLFVKSLASDKEMYKYTGIKFQESKSNEIKGEIHNFGTYEINVPQLLYSFYDINGNIIWCDAIYLEKGIRSQRKKPFTISLFPTNEIRTLKIGHDDNSYVNGSPNKFMTLENKANHNKKWDEIYSQNNINIKIQSNGFIYELNK